VAPRCTLNNEWVSSTAAANGLFRRAALAACITLIRLGPVYLGCASQLARFCVAQPWQIVRVKRVTDFIENHGGARPNHLEKLVRFDLALRNCRRKNNVDPVTITERIEKLIPAASPIVATTTLSCPALASDSTTRHARRN